MQHTMIYSGQQAGQMIGLATGGLIIDSVGWRGVFYINSAALAVPICIQIDEFCIKMIICLLKMMILIQMSSPSHWSGCCWLPTPRASTPAAGLN